MTQVDFYDKGQIDAKEIGAPTDEASASGSLWARIKNAVSRIGGLETADANNVKKTGTNTVTGDIQVPTTPATPLSVINSAYANDPTDGVNNIVHKSGDETVSGNKTFISMISIASSYGVPFRVVESDMDITDPTYKVVWSNIIYDKNLEFLGGIGFEVNTDGRTRFFAQVRNADGTAKIADIVAGDP